MDDSYAAYDDYQDEDQESHSDDEGNEYLEMDGSSIYATPPLTPTSSCYWSCFSSFDDLPEYLDAENREGKIVADHSCENVGSKNQLLDYATSIEKIDSETSHANKGVSEYRSCFETETDLLSAPLRVATSSNHEASEDGKESTLTSKNNKSFSSSKLRIYEDTLKNELKHDELASSQSINTGDGSEVEATISLATVPFLPYCEANTAIHMPPELKDLSDDVADNLGINQNSPNEGHIKLLLEHDVAKPVGELDIDYFHITNSENDSESRLAAEANSSSHASILNVTSTCDCVTNREGKYESEMKLEKNLPFTSSELFFYNNELENELSHDNFGYFESGNTCYESGPEDVTSLERSLLANFETDPTIWMPPEPENLEDGIDSVTTNDDDKYGHGTTWDQPSSLQSLNEKNGKTHKYKEDQRKAMVAIMNGKFRILVRQLLVSQGISFSATEDNPSWLDIVVLLSWEAAQFVKPEASEGVAMDPTSYVKVKCVASGNRCDSQVIKGLVFKKNAAHKHMTTNLKNPKLLLLQGALGHSLVGLSSFKSMDREIDHLTSITEMIENFHPDVVMVEKTVSREVQECLLAKRITLVFEMKLNRLERIARCIGSPIISAADFPKLTKLNQCESFHIEKIVEEHNLSDGGKKSSKTLMFLEGFPKPLGCTILLKGAHSDELKKIKHVLQYTVFAAYHLIFETSFLADQKVLFADKDATDAISARSSSVSCDVTDASAAIEGSATALAAQDVLHFPVLMSNRTAKSLAEEGVSFQSYSHVKGLQTFPRCDSANSLFGNTTAHQFCHACKSETSDYHGYTPYFGFDDKLINDPSMGHCTLLTKGFNHEDKLNHKCNDEKQIFHAERALLERDPSTASVCRTQDEERFQSVLVQESILILQSRYCITKKVTCEESHLSRIKYYGNCDVSLERFLKDTLFNKMSKCSSCEEPMEAHIFSYTHRNGNLSVLVRHLPQGLHLLGENEGRIWMWTRCLKCRDESIHTKRRVLLSGSALKLSFGKFLEISFSVQSAATRLSKCGHSLLRDSLRFFGLGSTVAMFKYSPVKIYALCKPRPVLEFHSVKGQQWLKKEIESILAKSSKIFTEVSKIMENFSKENIQISGSFKEYSEIREMLIDEQTEFEDYLLKSTGQNCQARMAVSQFLGLRWLNQELLLQLYVWDQRVQYLLHNGVNKNKNDTSHQKYGNTIVDDHLSASTARHCTQDMQTVSAKISRDADSSSHLRAVIFQRLAHTFELFSDRPKTEKDVTNVVKQNYGERQSNLFLRTGNANIGENEGDLICGETFLRKESDLQIETKKVDDDVKKPNVYDASTPDLCPSMSATTYGLLTEDMQKLCWFPLSELRKELKKDLEGGSLQKFEFLNTYTPSYLSPINQPSSYQLDLLHFIVGPGGTVMTASEDEISSIIACALAFSDQQRVMDMIENETVGIVGPVHETVCSNSDYSVPLTSWLSSHSAESGALQSFSSSSSDKLPILCSDGLLSGDKFTPSYNLHPETAVGVTGKSKFSVVSIYAKEFYRLRRKCCPSELAYICSLSRCQKWDPQGGKSKAFFAKTMDDRFILKQIKKAELESFLKFGPEYFKQVSLSLESGSQSCLAKILGIYQVKQNKSGKELKLDLLVMENLMFGHNISRIYDLKGAMFSRYAAPNSNKVLLDQNFVEDMLVSPIYVSGKAKRLLERAIWNDTSFLTSVHVMDYSLLVGIDKQRHELVFGIIDYLRQYTWDKKLETWVKASIVVPKNELPTIVSPKEYKKRFRKFISKYFLTVPDSLNSEQCPIHCIFCTDSKHSCGTQCCADRAVSEAC